MPIQFSMKELRTLHAFHPDTLAYRANVSESIVTAMLNSQPVPKAEALKVLAALSTQFNRYYTLSNVRVKLLEEQVQIEEVKHV